MHRWSQLFIPTLREAPADAEVASHKFWSARDTYGSWAPEFIPTYSWGSGQY